MQKGQSKIIEQGFWVETYKREGVKSYFNSSKQYSEFQISSQFTTNFTTALTSPNLYVTRTLNNMNEAKLFKKDYNDWTRLYHKLLQGIGVIVDVQKQVWNIIKIVGETNTTIIEMEGTILKASNNYWTMNTMNIFSISEDLQSLVQSDMKNRVYQIQRMLANKLDSCKERENKYVDNNIKKI